MSNDKPPVKGPVSSKSGARRVRVMAASDFSKEFYPMTFLDKDIQSVVGTIAGCAALILISGTKIPTSLSYEELEQKIYSKDLCTDEQILDLRNVTGKDAINSDEPAIGDTMPDGTIFAGISPTTGKKMFAAPEDAPMGTTFNQAIKYAKSLQISGKKGFRVPTKEELNVLFQNREKGALKGTFNSAGSGWYWSSSHGAANGIYKRCFNNGATATRALRYTAASVRCVR